MICDYLKISVPESDEHSCHQQVIRLLSTVGGFAVTDELMRIGQFATYRHDTRRGFGMFGFSGKTLAAVREGGLYDDLLSIFSSVPHRVTSMDIAMDLERDAPPILNKLFRKASRGGLRLSRKAVTPANVRKHFAVGANGVETGTVYVGSRKSEVRCKVYDKRQELLDNQGYDVGAPRTRYELSITHKAGASLHAAHSPDAAFWHYMREVLPPPANSPVFDPSAVLGFVIPKQNPITPGELLMRKVSSSPEVALLLQLAEDCGPNGFNLLVSQLRKRATSSAPVVLEVVS